MSSFSALIDRVRAQIEEVEVESVAADIESDEEVVVIDVREPDEFADGHIPTALFIPRGLLDLRVESAVPDKSRRIVLYCAGGARSALAARTLGELDYTNVSSMAGGFGAWKRAGLPFVMPTVMSPEQQSRYSRHLLVPEVGDRGQRRLLDARVLLLGAGGLGSPAALYLAAAGVGTLGIIDDDVVDRSNLQRQVLHADNRVGTPKVDSAETTIRGLNPDVEVTKFQTRLTGENVLDILPGWDLVIDGGDNFATRYLLNDACVHLGIQNVHGSVYRFEGQATVFAPGEGPCYRCLYPEPPPPELSPSCQEAGVLGVVPGVLGLVQATEALKLLLGIGDPLIGRLLTFDALAMEFRELRFGRDAHCPACGEGASFEPRFDYQEFCGASKPSA